jgi:3D-(3,5/4)-trihydroxycyclohexane-1,2-dione acylhydrolase (decyclizing)
VALLRTARRPLLVAGGGVRYSGAAGELIAFAQAHAVPVVETPAGRTLVPHAHPNYGGALGIIGSASANKLAAEADVVLAVGTRLQDFTTSSWTAFHPGTRLIQVNAARFDAVKHAAHAVVGDARQTLRELDAALDGWRADAKWSARAVAEKGVWDAHIDALRRGVAPDGSLSYAQVLGIVNDASGPDDYVLSSSGGYPGEVHGGWRTVDWPAGSGGATSGATMDLEYGFSCMGYEVAGPWGAAMARATTHPDGLVTTLLGDGSYLMLNSELFSAAFSGYPFVAVVCDNGGYAVIHRLQTNQGAEGFNNLLDDARGPGAEAGLRVDFVAHARSLGCTVEDVPDGAGPRELRVAYAAARSSVLATRRPAVVVCRVHPTTWTEAGAWWEVGVPAHLSGRPAYDKGKASQLRWLGEGAPGQ